LLRQCSVSVAYTMDYKIWRSKFYDFEHEPFRRGGGSFPV